MRRHYKYRPTAAFGPPFRCKRIGKNIAYDLPFRYERLAKMQRMC